MIGAILLHLALLAVPQHPPVPAAVELNRAGVLKINQHLFREAAALFKDALAADPDFNLARVNQGIALMFDMTPEPAIALLREALSRDEEDAAAHFCLGLILKARGESDEAIAHFQRVLKIDPGCSFAHYNLGVLYVRRRQLEPAEKSLRACLELDPVHAPALYNLGLLLTQNGRRAEGKELIERSQAVRRRTSSSGMGSGALEYGEMGKYTIARD
jgi:tetratricopeptide (TPR) repeat protein